MASLEDIMLKRHAKRTQSRPFSFTGSAKEIFKGVLYDLVIPVQVRTPWMFNRKRPIRKGVVAAVTLPVCSCHSSATNKLEDV
jgi:hypothetical protein